MSYRRKTKNKRKQSRKSSGSRKALGIRVETTVLAEPLLEFGHHQHAVNPRVGLSIFGPHDLSSPSHPEKISYGVIGTKSAVEKFRRFTDIWRGPIGIETEGNSPLWPVFPGFETVFGTKWPDRPTASLELNHDTLESKSKLRDAFKRAGEIVDEYMSQIRLMKKSDERIDVVFCLVPDIVFKNCRPESIVRNAVGESVSESERATRASQNQSAESYDPAHYRASPDFRRQLKARAMQEAIPIQILRESTLSITDEEVEDVKRRWKRGLTPLSDRAWNISTTLFYKAGGKPWRLSDVRDGVCYIGISYRRTMSGESRSACCAAQMFLKDGDGVIFKGEEGVWYSPSDKVFHLSPDGATKLLKGVLEAYKAMGGKPLKEIFLHCPSYVSEEEYKGFLDACPEGAKLVSVRVRQDKAVRLFRVGPWPVVRGTFWKQNDKTAFLWASGFKYSLGTYDGAEIPIPVRIDILHGEATIEQVAKDIFSLTKLNYNTCKIGESSPVTIGFSDAVGEILVSNPGAPAYPQFKYYPHLQNADRAKLSPHMVGEADAVNLEYELFHLLGDRLL